MKSIIMASGINSSILHRTFIGMLLEILLRSLRKTNLLRVLNISVPHPRNRLLKVPILRGIGISHIFDKEVWLLKILERVGFKSSFYFLDIGANVGQTLLKFKTLFPNGKYIGVEPNPVCVFYLKTLITSNGFENTTILPVALANYTGLSNFTLYHPENEVDTTASIVENFRNSTNSKSSWVPVLQPSEIKLLGTVNVQFIKIDVEGAELEVLLGLENLILMNAPQIVCEILPCYSGKNLNRYNRLLQIEAFVKRINYIVQRIYLTGHLELLDSFPVDNDLENTNYLLSPKPHSDIESN